MAKYVVNATITIYLEKEIEAEDEDEAWDKLMNNYDKAIRCNEELGYLDDDIEIDVKLAEEEND